MLPAFFCYVSPTSDTRSTKVRECRDGISSQSLKCSEASLPRGQEKASVFLDLFRRVCVEFGGSQWPPNSWWILGQYLFVIEQLRRNHSGSKGIKPDSYLCLRQGKKKIFAWRTPWARSSSSAFSASKSCYKNSHIKEAGMQSQATSLSLPGRPACFPGNVWSQRNTAANWRAHTKEKTDQQDRRGADIFPPCSSEFQTSPELCHSPQNLPKIVGHSTRVYATALYHKISTGVVFNFLWVQVSLPQWQKERKHLRISVKEISWCQCGKLNWAHKIMQLSCCVTKAACSAEACLKKEQHPDDCSNLQLAARYLRRKKHESNACFCCLKHMLPKRRWNWHWKCITRGNIVAKAKNDLHVNSRHETREWKELTRYNSRCCCGKRRLEEEMRVDFANVTVVNADKEVAPSIEVIAAALVYAKTARKENAWPPATSCASNLVSTHPSSIKTQRRRSRVFSTKFPCLWQTKYFASMRCRPVVLLSLPDGVTEHPVGEAANDDVHCVFHHDVHLVLRRHRAALQQTKPWNAKEAHTHKNENKDCKLSWNPTLHFSPDSEC